MSPCFSVAIPNYNYASYLGQTIESVLAQGRNDLEIHVSDNASDDDSQAVVRSYGDRGVSLSVNRTNVGFAGNLDRAVRPTRGRFVNVLSSDDLIQPGAFDVYAKVLRWLGDDAERSVITSASDVVDSVGRPVGRSGPIPQVWGEADRSDELSALIDARVLEAPGPVLLARAMRSMRNPIGFCSTLYPRALYDEIEGYGAGRLINPDKWFNWRLCGVAKRVIYVDRSLFSYRVHARNQTSQQERSGALKHLTDEYVYTFDTPDSLLRAAGVSRDELVAAFVEHDVVGRGLAALLNGDRFRARRHYWFGRAAYPEETKRRPGVWLLGAATMSGPAGPGLAKWGLRAYERMTRNGDRREKRRVR